MPERTTRFELGGVVIIAIMFLSGMTLLILTRYDVLPGAPWRYLGVAIAIFSGVLALVLGVMRAAQVSRR